VQAMNILEELWYGNVSPNEMNIPKGSKLNELLKEIIHSEEQLDKTLTDEQKQLLENLKNAQLKFNSLTECEVFAKGFKLGAKIMLEILN
jgi:hypothetical protein